MSTDDLRELLATRRELGGAHDTTQTILEGLLDRVEALESLLEPSYVPSIKAAPVIHFTTSDKSPPLPAGGE